MKKRTGHKGIEEFATFEECGMVWHTVTADRLTIEVSQVEHKNYLATLIVDNRPLTVMEGATAKWALVQLMKECKNTNWTETNFYSEILFPLAKDLKAWMERPARETYNDRR